MKYIKKYNESNSKDISGDRRTLNEIYELRKELVDKILKEMNPNPVDVVQDIQDIFLEWNDLGISLDTIFLSTPYRKMDNQGFQVYSPLGWKYRSEINYHLSCRDIISERQIVSFMQENNKLYYDIEFGVDEVSSPEYTDYNDESQIVRYDKANQRGKLVRDCSESISERLKKMYNNVNFIKGESYSRGYWVPRPTFRLAPTHVKATRVFWLVEISN